MFASQYFEYMNIANRVKNYLKNIFVLYFNVFQDLVKLIHTNIIISIRHGNSRPFFYSVVNFTFDATQIISRATIFKNSLNEPTLKWFDFTLKFDISLLLTKVEHFFVHYLSLNIFIHPWRAFIINCN